MAQVRLLSMTVVLTALIWTSADRLVNDDSTVEIALTPTPTSSDSGMVASLAPQQRSTVELQISGPRRAIETLRARGELAMRLPTAEYPTGPRSLPIDPAALRKQLAQRWTEFNRVHVVSVTPPTMEVVVDHFVERKATVVARTLTLAYDAEPQVQRTSTTVRLRESFLNSLPDGQDLQIDIGPDVERSLRDNQFGRSVTVTVPLDARAFGEGATIVPASLDVTATVRSQQRQEKIPTVPVLVALSFANLETSLRAVDRDGNPISLVTRTITVTGPPDAVARLARGETRAYGIIRMKEDDLREKNHLRLYSPDYHLPPEITLASEPDPVELQLVLAEKNPPGE